MTDGIIRTATKFAMSVTERYIREGDTAVDATAGNGNDTLALSALVGEKGKVYAFDIQKTALDRTKKLLAERGTYDNVVLICGSHENMSHHIEEKGRVSAIVFNLGYLPSGDRSIFTRAKSSPTSIEEGLKIIKKGGIISIVTYPGTEEGKAEADAVLSYTGALDSGKYHVCRLTMPNQKGAPPEIIWIEIK